MIGTLDRRVRMPVRVMLLTALALAGCAGSKDASGPVVLEIKGNRLTLDDVRMAYENQDKAGSFESATAQQRTEFLETVGDKEVLLSYARERIKELNPSEKAQVEEVRQTILMKALESRVVTPIRQDSVSARYLKRFQRELHLLVFGSPSDSIAQLAHAEVVAGATFQDVITKYCKDEELIKRKGDIGWNTPEQMGREAATELWIDYREVGYLSRVFGRPNNYVFYKILEIRDANLAPGDRRAEMLPQLAQLIRGYNGMMAHLDSLRTANGFKILDENIPVLMKGMNLYWDSLSVVVKESGKRPDSFRPPVWKFSAEEGATPLCTVRGKPVSVSEFVASLKDIAPKIWPMGTDLKAVRDRIDYRMLVTMQLDEAHAIGLDREPGYLYRMKSEEEKILLGKLFQDEVAKGITVSPEEVRAYYDRNIPRYTKEEAVRFSYVIFPTKAEAKRLSDGGKKNDLNWWSTTLLELRKDRKDVIVNFNTREYAPVREVPDTVRAAVQALGDSDVGTILDPVPTINDRWMVPRVTFHQRAGTAPLEKVQNAIELTLKNDKADQQIQRMVDEGRKKFGLKLYPDRLGPKG